MKIVNLEQFKKLPAGVLFMKYEPCVFDHLCMKGETLPDDWVYENLTYEIDCASSDDYEKKLFMARELGVSLQLEFNNAMGDGCFDDDQLFAVYEKQDIEALINKLKDAIGI